MSSSDLVRLTPAIVSDEQLTQIIALRMYAGFDATEWTDEQRRRAAN